MTTANASKPYKFWSLLATQTVSPSFPSDWSKFLDTWAVTSHPSALKGLLGDVYSHSVQETEKGVSPHAPRVHFLLQNADGWSQIHPYDIEEPDDGIRYAKHVVATRAYQVLCDKVFADNAPLWNGRRWDEKIMHEETIEAILWFFRFNKDGKLRNAHGHGNGCNDARRHQVMLQFLRDFCELAWKEVTQMSYFSWQKESLWPKMVSVRPRLYPIMEYLHTLHLFHNPHSIYTADDAFIKVWKESVLSTPLPYEGDRLPKDCLEAAANGGYAAVKLLPMLSRMSGGDNATFLKLVAREPEEK